MLNSIEEIKKQQFRDWESRVFGVGYGNGELPILKVVKKIFDLLEKEICGTYDYRVLEENFGETVTWLLITTLAKGNVIEWSTSTRFGWLTSCGEHVRDFIKDKTVEELCEIVESDEIICVCDGTIKDGGHENCGKNPMVNEKYALELKYKNKPRKIGTINVK